MIQYYINGISFDSLSVHVSASKGIVDKLKVKEQQKYSWPEEHGDYVDLTKPRFEARDIILECFIEASSPADFITKMNAFWAQFEGAGTKRFMFVVDGIDKPFVYEVFAPESIDVEKEWNVGTMAGTFTLKLREPEPVKKVIKYTATSILLPADKTKLRAEWIDIVAEKSYCNQYASVYSITTENTAYNAAFQSLATYLNNDTTWSTGTPSWINDTNLSVNTNISLSVFESTFKTYYDARKALFSKIASKSQAQIDESANILTAKTDSPIDSANKLATMSAIDDGIMWPAQKQQLRIEWNKILAERANINYWSPAYSISSSSYVSAFEALSRFLDGSRASVVTTGYPQLLDDNNIGLKSGSTGMVTLFTTYYNNRTTLLNSINTASQSRLTNYNSIAVAAYSSQQASLMRDNSMFALNVKGLEITLTSLKRINAYFGDGSHSYDIAGNNIKVYHNYTIEGEYIIILTGVVEEITSITTNGTIIWNRLL
jgi:hypothetical protein